IAGRRRCLVGETSRRCHRQPACVCLHYTHGADVSTHCELVLVGVAMVNFTIAGLLYDGGKSLRGAPAARGRADVRAERQCRIGPPSAETWGTVGGAIPAGSSPIASADLGVLVTALLIPRRLCRRSHFSASEFARALSVPCGGPPSRLPRPTPCSRPWRAQT